MSSKKIKVQPITPVLVRNLVTLAERMAELRGVKVTTIGTESRKTASFFTDLKSRDTSCTLRTYDLLTEWFAENWPSGHPMPVLEDTMHYLNRDGHVLHLE